MLLSAHGIGASREAPQRVPEIPVWVGEGLPVSPLGGWRVLRHGGRRTDDWRSVPCERSDEATSRAVYVRVVERMRQGGARLVAPCGCVVEDTWAPRLRSRW